jgi:hypothetical protein
LETKEYNVASEFSEDATSDMQDFALTSRSRAPKGMRENST